MLMLSRGSAYEIAFAAQMHENRGRVPRFSYFQREKVSAWELSDVRVLQSQNTDCRKNEVFRQSESGQAGRFSRIVDNPVDKLWISLSMVHTKATALPLQSKMIVLPDRRDTSKNILKNDIL